MKPKSAVAAEQRAAAVLKKRYRRILRFAALVLLQSWWFEILLPMVGLPQLAARGRVKRLKKVAIKFRALATELTGLMIKVGQFVSSRLDVLPIEITSELDGLQDEVAPEPEELVRQQIESALGMPLDVAFEQFESTPIAAASLGQAHLAKLPAQLLGTMPSLPQPDDQPALHHPDDAIQQQVVVKVLRPGIEEVVDVDLKALRRVAVWMSRVKLVSRRADVPALVEEFAQTTYQEIDYYNEARNLERFATDFESDEYVGTPKIIWNRTGRRVLTMTNVAAIKISDVESLAAAQIDPNAVAAEFARVTFQQIFVNGFFHADPHPGNIFVTQDSRSPGGFRLTFIDFGMMGQLSQKQQEDLRRFIFAVVSRDAQGWVSAVERLKLLLPSADTAQLEQAIEALFQRFGGLGVAQIMQTDPAEFIDFAKEFGDLVRELPFQIPENFLLLVRSISLVSGVTSSLNRDFNMWDALDPFARTLLQRGSGGLLNTVYSQGREALFALVSMPRRIDSILGKLERGDLTVRNLQLDRTLRKIARRQRQTVLALVFGILISGGIYLHQHDDWLGNLFLIGAAATGLVAIFRN